MKKKNRIYTIIHTVPLHLLLQWLDFGDSDCFWACVRADESLLAWGCLGKTYAYLKMFMVAQWWTVEAVVMGSAFLPSFIILVHVFREKDDKEPYLKGHIGCVIFPTVTTSKQRKQNPQT